MGNGFNTTAVFDGRAVEATVGEAVEPSIDGVELAMGKATEPTVEEAREPAIEEVVDPARPDGTPFIELATEGLTVATAVVVDLPGALFGSMCQDKYPKMLQTTSTYCVTDAAMEAVTENARSGRELGPQNSSHCSESKNGLAAGHSSLKNCVQ